MSATAHGQQRAVRHVTKGDMVHQRAFLASLPRYKQGAAPTRADAVKLSSNENPYPPLPSVTAALARQLEHIQIYPAMAATEIRQRLADYHGVTTANIAVGAGSVEVATQLVNVCADADDEVVFAWRSFEAYPIIVRIAGARPVPVPLTREQRHDLDAMADAVTDRTRLILVCTPNNPTGTAVGRDELEAFLARVPSDVVVAIDEAYVQFNRAPDSADGLDFYRRHPNVVVLRTFSKAYGLAGLRIGYAVAPEPVAANLRQVALPFGVSGLAQHAALASLDAEAELMERAQLIIAERERLTTGLRSAGWSLVDSHANFVWLAAGDKTDAVDAVLAEHGVIARAFSGDGIRITVGTHEANDRVIAAAREALTRTDETPSSL